MDATDIQNAITTANNILTAAQGSDTNLDSDEMEKNVGILNCQINSLVSSDIEESNIEKLEELIDLVEKVEVKNMLTKHLSNHNVFAQIEKIKRQIEKIKQQIKDMENAPEPTSGRGGCGGRGGIGD